MSWRSDIGLRSWESSRTMSHDCASIPSPATGVTVTFQDLSDGPKVDSTSVRTISRGEDGAFANDWCEFGGYEPQICWLNYWIVVLDLIVDYVSFTPDLFYICYFVCLFLPLLWQSPLTNFEESSLRVGQTKSALVCTLRLRSKTRLHLMTSVRLAQ